MLKKQILVYYSDCTFFAGCESMIPNFLNSKKLNNYYETNFVYRNNEIYERELKSRLKLKTKLFGINLLEQNIHKKIFSPIIKIKILYYFLAFPFMLFWKYFLIFYSIIPIYNIFKKLKPHVVHINNGGYPAAISTYSAVFAAKAIGVKKIIYVVNNIATDYKNPLRWLDYLLDKVVCYCVDIFVTGSKNAMFNLAKVLNLNENKVISIPNGITLRKVILSKPEFLKKLKINLNGRLIFSTIALLEKRKGHIWLLKSIKILIEKNEFPNIPLFIIEGNGPEKKNIEKFIYDHNLKKHVILIDYYKNIFDLINASDVIILPSIKNEDFPNVIIESMGMSKPVIGTKIAGIPEQIDHDKNGYLVNPQDPEDLYHHIAKIMKNNRIDSFSKSSKIKFDMNYDVSISVNKYINLYKN